MPHVRLRLGAAGVHHTQWDKGHDKRKEERVWGGERSTKEGEEERGERGGETQEGKGGRECD